MRETKRTALVTAGSRGIGAAICEALAEKGYRVAINYHKSENAAKALVKRIEAAGGEAFATQADASCEADVQSMFEAVARVCAGVDVLVNNLGDFQDASVERMTLEEWRQAIDLNLTSCFLCTREAIAHMKQSGWGRIINISSQAAFTGSIRHAHYSAAKAGMLGFTYSVAKELAGYGITANVVSPGRIDTEMLRVRLDERLKGAILATPVPRLGTAHEVAALVAFLALEASSYITGANVHVNGGLVMG